jgi:uncharacterized protein YjlB
MRIESMTFAATAAIPNNPRLPVIVYRGVLDAPGAEAVHDLEAIFGANGWPAQWRNGVSGYHHYHTLGHEALGCAAGTARVLLGGPDGREVELAAGDVLPLPAGTGHCRLAASDDLVIVGAYPPGQLGDMVRDAPTSDMLDRIRELPVPASDPVGADDGVTTRWR